MTATEPRSARPRRSRRSDRPRRGSRVVNAVAGLALAAAAVGVQRVALTPNEISAPIASVGGKGQEVSAGRFSARVDSFASARHVQTETKTVPAEQLFLVVQAAGTSSREPMHFGKPLLRTPGGTSFEATDKVDSARLLTKPWVQPGFWVSGFFVFEVPASALEGARVVFRLPTSALVEPFKPEVEVDLGIDEAAAKQLSSAPQDVYSLKKSS
ncbi:hypothetical protein [Nonomuraea typhae]|uniref:DUF4352 domain-containing protein n=1 Tax=Nonomuraea typhae TaxID=2603600 RepID=A0ABW7Z1F0_9ACTN